MASSDTIRVLVADDHPAVRLGLERLIAAEAGFVHAASAANGDEVLPKAQMHSIDCVVLDYQMPGGGLRLCRRLKELCPPPGVVLYTGFAGERLAVAALLAGVNALVDKSSPADRIFDSIHLAARGLSTIRPSPAALTAVAEGLDADDLAVFGMLIDGTSVDEIGEALRLPFGDAAARAGRLVGRTESQLPLVAS